MRRNNNMGRGRGGPQYDRGDVWGGPLMLEHMSVSNLDKELQDLRRRREDIQRQQEMLTMETAFHRKRQYEPQQSNRDFSNMYGNVWESSPPKRFNFPPVKPWAEGAGPECPRPLMENPVDSNYIPPFNNLPYSQGRMRPIMKPQFKPIVHPILKQGVGQRGPRPTPYIRKDFKPKKITKNKPQAPNNLKSYPVAERKNLINKAVATQGSGNQKSAHVADPLVREDQLTSQQITGRLELALGNLVKEIKSSFTDNVEFSNLVENNSYQRIMKQAVRERIRQAMIGHSVGPISDIVAKYREMFPKDTDKEIVDLVVNAKDAKKVTVVDSDDPEEFFKTNISGIIEKKMEEIFLNLVKMYSSSHRKQSLAYTQASNDEKKTDQSTEKVTSKTEDITKVVKSFTGFKITLGEKKVLQEFYTELIENILEEKIPEVLPKCMKHIIKIFDVDHQYKSIKFMTIKRIRDNEKSKISGAEVTESKEEKVNQEEAPNEEIARIEEIATNEEDATNNDEALNQEEKEEKNLDVTVGETTQNETSEIQEETQNVSIENGTSNTTNHTNPTTPEPAAQTKDKVTNKTPKMPATPSLELPYYVKLFGRPKLPTRAAIHDFLKEYHPVSIKKHKSINNLLVVGFSNEEDYNKIVAATETVFENITIIIKAGEKATGKENDSTSNGNETQKEEKVKELAPQAQKDGLDEQVRGLLSTIRQTVGGNIQSENANSNGTTENADSEMTAIDKKTGKTQLEPVKEVAEDDKQESEKDKGTEGNIKETGRATPARASSRLANVSTPSSIRTRRASRLMQE